jgi:hypothetical protein
MARSSIEVNSAPVMLSSTSCSSPSSVASSVALPSAGLERLHPQLEGTESLVESCHRHDRYYLEDGVVLQVECLYYTGS